MKYLDYSGVTHLWKKMKGIFLPNTNGGGGLP